MNDGFKSLGHPSNIKSMCGIAGFISFKKRETAVLQDMTNIIKHRGPDDEGFTVFSDTDSQSICLGGSDTPEQAFQSDFAYKPAGILDSNKNLQARIGLGHRRLSILDLSVSGHQPMSTKDRRYWIVYNGEVYNYIELRNELTNKGYQFVSDTDTEVILASYQEWGEQCLDKLNGMWAFVIYDSLKHELFMGRDRFGIKPLYYWFDKDNTLFWGSEIKQFTVCDGWEARLNKQRAYDYLLYALTDHTEETMFQGVFHLPPGHYYKSSIENIHTGTQGKLNTQKWYWVKRDKPKLSLSEAANCFESKFKSSVRRHLRSDVPVGSALSGGLDSSAIVCEINKLLCKEGKNELQKTFSSCSENQAYSEKKWMDIVVNSTKVDAHYTFPEIDNLFDLTPEILWHQDEPYQSQSVYLGYHVFELAQKNGVKVLLNGQGADEYLAGYGQYRNATNFQLFKTFRWLALYEEYKYTMNGRYNEFIRGIIRQLIPDFLIGLLRKNSSSHIESLIDLDRLGAQNIHPYETMSYDSSRFKLSSFDDITRLHLFHNPLPRYLRWEDRNSMAHSIEARVPFLDKDLVEYTFNLPADYIYKKGITKLVMREGLKKLLPEEIANRKDKKGFITPEEQWVKENPQVFKNKIKEAISITDGIITQEAVAYFDKVSKGQISFDYTYWRLIQFSEWLKLFNVKF